MSEIDKIHKRFAEIDGPDWRERSVERLEMIYTPVSTGMTWAGAIEIYHGELPWWQNRTPQSSDEIIERWKEMFPDE